MITYKVESLEDLKRIHSSEERVCYDDELMNYDVRSVSEILETRTSFSFRTFINGNTEMFYYFKKQ